MTRYKLMTKKQNILFLTILSTILSLVLAILSYMGLSRLIYINSNSIEHMSKVYRKIPKASDKQKVVVSFEVSDEKQAIRHAKSILDQTRSVDSIVAVDTTDNGIPSDSQLRLMATIVPAGSDKRGQYVSVLYPLIREKNCDAVIISTLSSSVIGKDFVESAITEYEKNGSDTLIYNDDVIVSSPRLFDCVFGPQVEYNLDWIVKSSKESKRIDKLICDKSYK